MSTIQSRSTGLSAEQRERYRDDGFLVLRGLFDAGEMAELAAEADSLAQRTDLIDKLNLRCRFQSQCIEGGECLFETFDPVIDLGPVSKRFARDPRILDVLSQIYGEEARLFKDKLIFKPAGALGYRLHQDFIAWEGFPRSFLTVLVPIDRAHAENGCTVVYRGYHQNGCLSPEDGDYHELPEETVNEADAVPLALHPGDIAIFGGFTPHRSAPNRSASPRRQLYLSYNANSDGGDRRDAHYADFREFLRRKYAEHGMTDTYYL